MWILVCSISWVKLSKISPHLLQLHLASNGRWFLSWILWCLKSSSTVKNESSHFLHLYLSRLLCLFLRCLKLSICVPNRSVQLSSLQWYYGNLLTFVDFLYVFVHAADIEELPVTKLTGHLAVYIKVQPEICHCAK